SRCHLKPASTSKPGWGLRADEDIVQRKSLAQQIVYPIQFATRLITARQPRLVGGCDQHQTSGLQLLQQRDRRLVDVELLQGQGSHLMFTFHLDVVQNAISFEKNTLLHNSEK